MAVLLAGCVFVLYAVLPEAEAGLGFHVFAAFPRNVHELNDIRRTLHQAALAGQVDVWALPRKPGRSFVFKVPDGYRNETEAWLVDRRIEYRLITREVERLIMWEATTLPMAVNLYQSRRSGQNFDLDLYNDHAEINRYLRSVVKQCDICRLIRIGHSYEGREMLVIKIGKWSKAEQAIWIDAGIHAREWIAPATALRTVNKLVSGYYGNDSDVTWMLDRFVWYVLPVANPDGYTFSRLHDRLWRKTRKPTSQSRCIGSDPNRNWDFHWAESGISFNRCSEVFPGEQPFSEPETRNMRRFLLRHRKHLLVYLSLHSFGQYWLYPWSHDNSLPPDWKELKRVGQKAVSEISRDSGTIYDIGSATRLLYAAAGTSDDWVKAVAKVKYTYTVELPDTGSFGFLLPAKKIEPTFLNLWPGLVGMTRAIQNLDTES